MSSIVLDTCALLWFTLDPIELTPGAHKAIAAADAVLVPSIAVWEIGIKTKRGKLDLGCSYSDYVRRIGQAADLRLVAIDQQLWAESVLLDWEHRDPADRVVVALAARERARIVTDDRAIAEFYAKTVC